MFIPPRNYKKTPAVTPSTEIPIRLQSSHLIIGSELATQVFDTCQNAYLVYYPDKKALMLAPVTDEIFKNLHKASQHMLKDKNLKGDKTIALHEILIDHQIEAQDRTLDYEWQSGLGILKVSL